MNKFIIGIFFLHLGFCLKAQVFNNSYNNYSISYSHPFQPGFSQYNRDALYDFNLGDSILVLFGSTVTPLWRDTILVNTWILEVDHQGDTLSYKTIEIDSNDVSIGFFPISIMDKTFLLGNAKKKFSNTTHTNNGLIIELDSNFNLVNYQLMDYGDFTNLNGAVLSYSKLYILGYSDVDSSSNSNYDIFVTKVNFLGQPIDTFQFGGSGWEIPSSIKLLSNSNLLVSGYTSSFGSGGEDFYLVEIDTLGNIIWENTYGGMGSDGNLRNNLEVDSQGYIYQCGWTEKMNGDVEAWIIKTDNVGAIVWDKKFNRGNLFDGFVGISLLENGEILLAGSTHNYDIASNNATGWLVKLDSTGSLIWERLISKYDNQFNTHDYIYKLKCDSNENIFIAGYILGGITENGIYHDNDGWFCKADKCGYTSGAQPQALLTIDSVVGAQVYISNLSEEYCVGNLNVSIYNQITGDTMLLDSLHVYAYSQFTNGTDPTQLIYTLPDTGTYIFSVTTYAGDGTDNFTTSIQVSDLSTGLLSNQTTKTFNFKIYPNPASDYVIVSCADGQGACLPLGMSEATLNIYTTTGQLIKSYSLNLNRIQEKVNIGDLANGVYLLNFMIDGRSAGNQRLSLIK